YGPDHVPTRGAELGLREAVFGVPVRRPRCIGVIADGHLAADVDRTDRHDERVVAGCVPDAAVTGRASVVACGSHDGDAAEPQLLHRLLQRVVVDVVPRARVEGDV